jgi:hypothetical protein
MLELGVDLSKRIRINNRLLEASSLMAVRTKGYDTMLSFGLLGRFSLLFFFSLLRSDLCDLFVVCIVPLVIWPLVLCAYFFVFLLNSPLAVSAIPLACTGYFCWNPSSPRDSHIR